MWSVTTGIAIKPSGQGFIGCVLAGIHFILSFMISRRKRPRESVWPTRKMLNFFIGSGALGGIWGVGLMIWDVYTATATHWRGFYKGQMTEATLYLEAVLRSA